jgi:hypothetical protein
MGFLHKVESALIKADIILPLKAIKLNKLKETPNKTKKARAPKAAEGKEKVGFSELTNTRKLTPFIKKEIQLTDPFNFTNETWTRFVKNVVPKLLLALLLDMNIVPKSRRAEFTRYLDRRLRTLAKN